MLKSNMVKYAKRDTESIVEIGGDKSKLKYTDFHDYISLDLYNEWKWLFNNLRKIEVTTDYADSLSSKVSEATTIATDRLNEVVELRAVDMDDSVTADNIDTTLDIMSNHYDRNRDAISATALDGDIKDKLNNYNVLMHELIVRVKKAMNESIVGMDTELFGFGKKYETCLVSADYDSYLKASKTQWNWKDGDLQNIQMHLNHYLNRISGRGDTFDFTPNSGLKAEIKSLTEKIKLLKEAHKTLGKKTEWHKTSLDSNFKDDQSFRKWNEKLLNQKDETLKEYDYYILPEVDDNTVPRSLYSGYRNLLAEAFDEILNIRRLIKNNIRVMSKDREEYDENNKGTYVSRRVVNNTELANWFSSQGIKVVPADELHTTISYSKVGFNHTPDNTTVIVIPSQFKSIEILGEDCLVIKMDSDELKANFDKCMSEGATYDYDEYIPHITIAIGVSPDIIPTLQLPDFPITLDVEKVEPLDLDWKSKITDLESIDLELFGFGKKYESDLNYVKMDQYLKGSMYFEATWEVIHSANGGFKNTDSAYEDMVEKIKIIKDNIAVGTAKRSMRIVSPDTHIIDDNKHNKIMKHIEDTYSKNKEYISKITDNDKRKSNLAKFNNEMYQCLKKIREILRKGIKEVKSTDKESIDLELFGFGKKYETCLVSGLFSDYTKNTDSNVKGRVALLEANIYTYWKEAPDILLNRYANEQFISSDAKILSSEVDVLKLKLSKFKDNISKLSRKTEWHNTSYDSDIVNDHMFNKTNKDLERTLHRNLITIDELEDEGVDVRHYRVLYKEIYDTIIGLRQLLKKNIRIMSKDREEYIDSESLDTELFGFGKKYESDLNYTTIKQYLKGSGYIENLFEVMGKSNPVKDFDFAYKDILEKVSIIKDNIAVGIAKRSMRTITPDTEIVNDEKYSKVMKHLEDKHAKNKEFIAGYKITDDKKSKLNRWNNEIYQALKQIREVLKKGIKPVKQDDKESYEYNGLSVVTSDVFNYVDMEGFQAISGLIATGFKKVSGVVSDISDMMSTSKPDYNNLVKGFFSKDRRYQDIYNYLIPVPAGYNGYVKDISMYVLNNIHQVNTLDNNLDNLINTLSSYINSSEYRESFAVDMSASKVIEAIASELYKENRKYLSESKEDSKPINKLLRSANELDDIIDNLKKADKILNLDQLESIKKKMKQVDNLVTIMIDNKSQYSKPKLLEIAKYIDAIISLSNAVGTVVYLKNSTDIILVDIKNIL